MKNLLLYVKVHSYTPRNSLRNNHAGHRSRSILYRSNAEVDLYHDIVRKVMQKYNIKVSNIPELSKMITGGTLTIAFVIIGFSVVKSFALVFPPAVVFSLRSLKQ